MKLNKKAELRIQHIVTAVLVMGLFGVFLFSMTGQFITNHSNDTITDADLTDAGSENRSAFYDSIEDINNMTSELSVMGKSAPGGEDSADPEETTAASEGIITSGYNFIANIGNWLFRYPIKIIEATIGFFGLPIQFTLVATSILIIMVVIILISSILKNRI